MHPEASSPDIDLLNLKRKVDAGGHFVTTQLFFDNTKYFEFVNRTSQAKIDVPVLPGLMCVTSREQILRFCAMCRASIPAELNQRLLAAGDDAAAVEAVGIDWVYHQARELLERGAPGIHLYILNREGPAVKIMEKLKAAGFYKA